MLCFLYHWNFINRIENVGFINVQALSPIQIPNHFWVIIYNYNFCISSSPFIWGIFRVLRCLLFSVFVILDNSILVINLVYLKWMLGLFMQRLYLYHRDNILFYLQTNLFSLLSCFLSEIQKLWKRRTCGLDSLVEKIFYCSLLCLSW